MWESNCDWPDAAAVGCDSLRQWEHMSRNELVAWDIRRSAPRQRGAAILEQMVARKTICLRRLGGTRKGEERVGRFFANPKVTAGKIIEGWSTLTDAACAGRHVLLIESLPRT
jgi:hypothetical protein